MKNLNGIFDKNSFYNYFIQDTKTFLLYLTPDQNVHNKFPKITVNVYNVLFNKCDKIYTFNENIFFFKCDNLTDIHSLLKENFIQLSYFILGLNGSFSTNIDTNVLPNLLDILKK